MQRIIAAALLAASLIAPVVAAHAGGIESELTLDEAARLAVERQPGLDAFDYAAQAAREASVAEGELPDPVVSVGLQNVPITGGQSLRLDAEDMTMATVGVMQEMVRPEKRRAAANRMQAESEQLALERAVLARQVARDAKLAWASAYEAARRSALYDRLEKELLAERHVAAQRLSSGAVKAGDVLKLDAAISKIGDERIQSEKAERQARARLVRWIGEAAQRPLPLAIASPGKAALINRAAGEVSAGHPQLAMLRAAIDVARYDADRARAARTPDWSWQVMYGYRQDDRSDMVSLQFAMPLQIDRANRQDRRVAEKLAMVARAEAITLDTERALQAELRAVQAQLDATIARLREHKDRLAPATRARLETAQAAYRSGTLPLAALWEARRAALETEIHHVALRAELLRAHARYDYLTGDAQ